MDIRADATAKQMQNAVQHNPKQQQRFLANIQAWAETPFFNKNQQKFTNEETRSIISSGRDWSDVNLPEREEILEHVNEKLKGDQLNKVNQKAISWCILKTIKSTTGQF